MRRRERGTAILITMIIIVALLGGGAVLVGMQMSSSRGTEIAKSNMTALYCAEAGLNAVRSTVANNYALWNTSLGTGTEPLWLSDGAFISGGTGPSHSIDPSVPLPGSNDFTVILKDNDDEPGGVQNYAADNDLQIWIVVTCNKFQENQKQVSELIRFNIGGTCYNSQLGGCGGNGNSN